MMKKLLIGMAAVVATALVAHAGNPPAQWNQPATQAVGNWYVGAYGGMNFGQTSLKADSFEGPSISTKKKIGWQAGFKVGYDFDTAAWVRPVLEGEWFVSGYNQNVTFPDGYGPGEPETVKFNTLINALMVNALAKFDAGSFQPYLGLGAGFYHMSMDYKEDEGYKGNFVHGAGFAWQALAGCDYKIDANWSIFTEYKWFAMYIADAKNKPATGENFVKSVMAQQQVNLGVRYQF